ncbi:MAG TPA: hypothetical protein VMU33_02540 [Burkholderiaceae bacterium]|nr:hypothetical protein [Burkholderiaceae bacterium]
METYYEDFEVVHVLNEFCLIDAESYERAYRHPTAGRLQPGFYVVSWPGETRRRRFDEYADFRGPYARIAEAWTVHDRLEIEARRQRPCPRLPPR